MPGTGRDPKSKHWRGRVTFHNSSALRWWDCFAGKYGGVGGDVTELNSHADMRDCFGNECLNEYLQRRGTEYKMFSFVEAFQISLLLIYFPLILTIGGRCFLRREA